MNKEEDLLDNLFRRQGYQKKIEFIIENSYRISPDFVELLNTHVDILIDGNELLLARELSDLAVFASSYVDDLSYYAGSLIKNAKCFAALRQTKTAVEVLLSAVDIYKKLDSKRKLAEIYTDIGVLYQLDGNFIQAISYFHKGLELYQEVNDRINIANSLCNIGIAYYDMLKIKESFRFYHKAFKTPLEKSPHFVVANSLLGIADIYSSIGRDIEALRYYEEALTIFRVLREKRKEISILSSLAALNKQSGNSNKSLSQYKECLSLQRQLDFKEGLSKFFSAKARIYFDLGMRKETLYPLLEAIRLMQETGKDTGFLQLKFFLHRLYRNLGQQSKDSLSFFINKIHILIKSEQPINLDTDNTYKKIGSDGYSLPYYHQYKASAQKTKIHGNYLEKVLQEIGELYLAMGLPQLAYPYFYEAIQINAEGDSQND